MTAPLPTIASESSTAEPVAATTAIAWHPGSAPAADQPRNVSTSPKIECIQHFRFVAACLVILFHSDLHLTRLYGGDFDPVGVAASGTDLFLVMGGFMLVHASYGKPGDGWSFLWQRLVRVAPLYWLVTIAMVALYLIAPQMFKTTRLEWPHVLASLAFLPYPHPVLGIDRPFLVPGWVLNYFVFFYVLFAPLRARPVNVQVGAMVAMLASLIALRSAFPHESRYLDFYGAPVVADCIIGLVVVLIYHNVKRMPAPFLVLAACTGAVIVALGMASGVSAGHDRVLYWGMAGGLFLLVCLYVERQGRWLRSPLLRRLGGASFSIFLSGNFTLTMIATALQHSHAASVIGRSGASVLLMVGAIAGGIVLHELVEIPLLQLLRPGRST
jgi:peptidoglycan/LPS O-acetylase OafA/YrhL